MEFSEVVPDGVKNESGVGAVETNPHHFKGKGCSLAVYFTKEMKSLCLFTQKTRSEWKSDIFATCTGFHVSCVPKKLSYQKTQVVLLGLWPHSLEVCCSEIYQNCRNRCELSSRKPELNAQTMHRTSKQNNSREYGAIVSRQLLLQPIVREQLKSATQSTQLLLRLKRVAFFSFQHLRN